MKPVRLKPRSRMALILLTVLTGVVATSPASAVGYWTCSGGKWTKVGSADYPVPMKPCGYRPHVPATEIECRQIGGRWGPVGIFPQPVCRVPTLDVDRTCGDEEECEGTCLADLTTGERDRLRKGAVTLVKRGRCSKYVQTYGCMAVVRKGRVKGLTCRD